MNNGQMYKTKEI